jgi:hypothetical protein
MRALFGDVDWRTPRRMANILDIDGEPPERACRAARSGNPAMQELAAHFDA